MSEAPDLSQAFDDLLTANVRTIGALAVQQTANRNLQADFDEVGKALASVAMDLVKASRQIERLREENRSLVQTVRRVLRGQPVEP
jgi:hypothetical protein